MSKSTLLPLVKTNLKNIVWCKLNRHFHTHVRNYAVNDAVFVVCKALKYVDSSQSYQSMLGFGASMTESSAHLIFNHPKRSEASIHCHLQKIDMIFKFFL